MVTSIRALVDGARESPHQHVDLVYRWSRKHYQLLYGSNKCLESFDFDRPDCLRGVQNKTSAFDHACTLDRRHTSRSPHLGFLHRSLRFIVYTFSKPWARLRLNTYLARQLVAMSGLPRVQNCRKSDQDALATRGHDSKARFLD